jgi:hypothetical protein
MKEWRFSCPHCKSQILEGLEETGDKMITCPQCGARLKAPSSYTTKKTMNIAFAIGAFVFIVILILTIKDLDSLVGGIIAGVWIGTLVGILVAGIVMGIARYFRIKSEPRLGTLSQSRDFLELFDINKYGLNLIIGIGYILARVINFFIPPMVIALTQGEPITLPPSDFYLFFSLSILLGAAIFVLIIHVIKKILWASLIFGLAVVLKNLTIATILFGGDEKFSFLNLLTNQKYSFFLSILIMLMLYLAVKVYGPSLGSFMMGSGMAYFFTALGYQLYVVIFLKHMFNWFSLAEALLSGGIFGLLIYTGFILFMGRRKR